MECEKFIVAFHKKEDFKAFKDYYECEYKKFFCIKTSEQSGIEQIANDVKKQLSGDTNFYSCSYRTPSSVIEELLYNMFNEERRDGGPRYDLRQSFDDLCDKMKCLVKQPLKPLFEKLLELSGKYKSNPLTLDSEVSKTVSTLAKMIMQRTAWNHVISLMYFGDEMDIDLGRGVRWARAGLEVAADEYKLNNRYAVVSECLPNQYES